MKYQVNNKSWAEIMDEYDFIENDTLESLSDDSYDSYDDETSYDEDSYDDSDDDKDHKFSNCAKKIKEENNNTNNDDDDYIVRDCPSCGEYVIIFKNELNCKIFRHGIFKDSHKQIPPHSNKLLCDSLFDKTLIYGCGKPFIYDNNDTKLKLCGYI